MAGTNPWELAQDDSSTSVPVSQLQAQGNKYTPDQMASFDKGRGQILAMENQGDTPPAPKEISYLNPTQLQSFNDSSVPPWQMTDSQPTSSAAPSSSAPWTLTQEKSPIDKVNDFTKKYLGMKLTNGNPGTELLSGLNAGMAGVEDLATFIPNAVAQGYTGLASLAMNKGDVGKAIDAMHTASSYFTVGDKLSTKEAQQAYELSQKPISMLADAMEYLDNRVKNHGTLKDDPISEAITRDVAAPVLAFALLHKATGATISGKPPMADVPKPKDLAGSVAQDMGVAPPAPKPEFMANGKVVTTEGEHPLGADATPDQMTQEFNDRQGGFNFDPHNPGENADLFDPSNRVTAPDQGPQTELLNQQAARQTEMPLEDTTTPPPAAVSKNYIDQFEKGQGLTNNPEAGPTTPDILSKTNIAATDAATDQFNASSWEKYKQRVAENKAKQEAAAYAQKAEQDAQAAKYSDDNFQPAQQSPTVDKMLGGVGRRGFKQGGAVNFGNGEDLGARLKALKESLSFTDRSREGIVVGDTVRLMNGKVGTVTDVKDGRYSIKSGDFQDSVPIQGIDYKYKPQGNAADAYKKAGEIASNRPLGGVGKKGFGQGGAIGGFRDTFEELRSKLDTLKQIRESTKDKPLDWVGTNLDTKSQSIYDIRERIKNIEEMSIQQLEGIKANPQFRNVYETNAKQQIKRIESLINQYEKAHNLGGVGKKGFGQGGAVNIRNFFRNRDPNVIEEEPAGVRIPMNKDDAIGILYKQWDRAPNPEGFKRMLEIEKQTNPNFPQEFIDNAKAYYQRFEDGWRPEKSVRSTLENLNQREGLDDRPYEQMAKETKIGTTTKLTKEGKVTVDRTIANSELKGKEDLGYFKKELFDPLHIISTNWDKPAGKVYAWAYGNMADIIHQTNVLLHNLMKFDIPFKQLNRRGMRNVLGAETYWDTNTNRAKLEAAGLDYPTKEMLMDKGETGLTSKEADAYLSHTEGYKQGPSIASIEAPKLAGYFPHTWNGWWRIELMHPEQGHIETIRVNSRMAANKVLKTAEDRGLYGKIVEPELSGKNNFVSQLQSAIQTNARIGKLGTAINKVLIDIQEGVRQGTITESLERHGIKGYLGDEGVRPENVWNPIQYIKNRQYNNQLFGVYERAMNDYVRAARNRAIAESVAKPFYQDLSKRFSHTKNLVDAVNDLISTATGFKSQENIAFDRAIKQFFINRGLSPTIPKDMIDTLNTFARFERINSANVGFALEHQAFALPGIFDLYRMHIERGIAKEKQGSFFGSLGQYAKDQITFGLAKSEEGRRVNQWAKDNGVYHSNYYDDPALQGTGGKLYNLASHKLLEMNINNAKSATFQMAYHYFKDIMPEKQALEAAKNHVKKTMQSFDAIDTPEIFKEGYGGRSIRPFNQIKIYNLARAAEQLGTYIKNTKTNPIQAQKLLLPIAGLAMTYFALGGAHGIWFHDDWNVLREWLMAQDPTLDLPGYEEFMTSTLHAPDWLTYGAVDNLIGADIRGTFGFNFTNMFSGAGLGAGGHMASLAFQKARGLITGLEDPDIVYEHERALLPTTLIPHLEDAESKKLGGNIPKPSSLEPQTPRTDAEDSFFKLTSKRPISESIRNEKIGMQKEIDARHAKARERYTDLIVKNMAGFDTGRASVDQIMNKAVSSNIGYDPQTLNRDIASKIKDLQLSAAITYIEKAAQSNDQLKASRFQTLLNTVRGGTLGQ